MIKIYEQSEIPKGFQETIQFNNGNLNKVQYVIVPEQSHMGCLKVVMKLSKEFALMSTITDTPFYVIYQN